MSGSSDSSSGPTPETRAETPSAPQTLHASCVAFGDRGALIIGPSGCGKSTLALELMGFGAQLVADDRVILTRRGNHVFASCPAALSGLIEARTIGILRAEPILETRIQLVIDLGAQELIRLPPLRKIEMQSVNIDLVVAGKHGHLAAAILQYLKAGRAE